MKTELFSTKMMPEYSILNSDEIYEYDAAIVPENEFSECVENEFVENEFVEYVEYIPVDCNQLVEPNQEIILEPMQTVETTDKPKHERVSRKRSYKPVPELVRPGKKAKVPDSDLTDKQLISRNKRRARNREAAQRQRDRRLQQTATLEEKIGKLESENQGWEEKYRILEEKYQKLEFQLKMQKRKFIGQSMTTNQNFGNAYKPAKLVKLNQRRKSANLKVTIPASVQPTVFPPTQASVHAPVSTMESIKAEESFCNINDYIKVDTPTAEHVKQMTLSGPDPFLSNLFDTNSTLNLL